MRRAILVICALVPTMGNACYNDRDTLGFELYNHPDLQRALTGRFDRYPPQYYEMRISRLTATPHLVPNEYDDLAVALSRLGRNDEALAVMGRKEKLAGLTATDRYRLLANRGTIEAHKWIQEGSKLESLPLMKKAESDIAEAIKVNPKAHFGREGTQLEVLRWMIEFREKGSKTVDQMQLSDWLFEHLTDVKIDETLSGLIMLGGAWESPDIAYAMGVYLKLRHQSEAAILAFERTKELMANGKHSIQGVDPEDEERDLAQYEIGPGGDKSLLPQSRFAWLRKEAESWRQTKWKFMFDRLRQGRHPDTDPHFWDGYHETSMPVLPTHKPGAIWLSEPRNIVLSISGVAALLALILMLRSWIKRVRLKS